MPGPFEPWRPGWIVFEPDRPTLCYSVPVMMQLAAAAAVADRAIWGAMR